MSDFRTDHPKLTTAFAWAAGLATFGAAGAVCVAAPAIVATTAAVATVDALTSIGAYYLANGVYDKIKGVSNPKHH